MAVNLKRFLSVTASVLLAVILACLILLTPADAIYQCYVSGQLTNIFFITGAYVATFLMTVMIYATRIYTNRTVLRGIPKAWIPVEREDVGKSVRRLVMEGLARSAIISFQARPRDMAADGDKFSEFETLTVDRERPPWGYVEHPGWSPPSSVDLPDLPYRTVVQELPHLIEAKAVSLAPPEPVLNAPRDPFDLSSRSSLAADQAVPDTRVIQVLQRPASTGLREYIQHLTGLDVIRPAEVGAEFVALYERARFSAHEIYETEFRDLMHVFAEVLRGMKGLDAQALDEIRDGSARDSESVIRASDEEGETDTVDFYEDPWLARGRSASLQPSNASTFEGRSVHATPTKRGRGSPAPSRHNVTPSRLLAAAPRTPSTRSLRRVQSNVSGSSGGSVIRLVDTQRPSDLPYAIDPGNSNNIP
ncbi:Thermatolerance membrane protein Dlt1 [Aspergillus sp. HF37]|nr:Thermatolerance membrane protein Dlt1 [Aspergillus sp. HF37]